MYGGFCYSLLCGQKNKAITSRVGVCKQRHSFLVDSATNFLKAPEMSGQVVNLKVELMGHNVTIF